MGSTYKADAVVVGGGLAGLAAALELLDAGRSIVLLERGPENKLGGLARSSFGGIFIVGSPEQRRAGIRDSADLALRDWLSFGEHGAEDVWPRRWAEAYVSGSRELVYDWLRGHGVKFFPVVHWVERGLYGGGNTLPRFHVVWGTGERLVLALLERLETHPHRDRMLLLHRHRVTDLDRVNGAFVGCSGVVESAVADGAAAGDAVVAEFAAEGDCLVLAAGGICGNLDLVRQHWPADWGSAPETLLNGSHPAADGHLHSVAARLGANVTHLDKMWNYAAGVHHWRPDHEHHGLSLVPPMSALWLNWRGERLGPPAMMAGYDTRYLVQTVCSQERQYSWQVFNWRIGAKELAVSGAEFNHAMRERKLLRFVLSTLRGDDALLREITEQCADVVTADSVPELAGRMNDLVGNDEVDAQTLAGEIGRYDEAVARGKNLQNDDQIRRLHHVRRARGDRSRTCKPCPIDDPRARPLIAIREFIISRKSLGGLQTDLQSRVLDQAGEPLPGLYAVGEAAGFGGGGIHGLRSLEGTCLGGCIFTGRTAAQAIIQATSASSSPANPIRDMERSSVADH